MFEGKTVAVVVPCYNEESQIDGVLATMPDFVDCVLVVDDHSTDASAEVVRRRIAQEGSATRIVLLQQQANRGQGAAVAAGAKEALRRGTDILCVMDGDGQMAPDELELLVAPVARGQADYAKGNRLFHRRAWKAMPRHRYVGNAFLSMLTKIASGYWHVADSQSAYVAVSRGALESIDLDRLYPRFGYPNDLLVRLNVSDVRVADVRIRPVYNVGERSKMRLWRVIPKMTWLIFRRFCWRMKEKYIIQDFHPLVLFYMAGALLWLAGVGLFVRMIWLWIADGRIPPINAMMWAFSMVSSVQFSLFAMWFDMEMNRHLRVTCPPGGVRSGPAAPAGLSAPESAADEGNSP